ncbi:MAG: alpha/beta hydrolase-fold protein [Bacteroidota bacterium]|nr:alpha/beta hydrolase-fold protein [Bacteroidota bacterium]
MIKNGNILFLFCGLLFAACSSKIKEIKEEVYSRHLQKHISLTIISTPVPKNKSDFNLLILNDAKDIDQLHVKNIVDSLYRKKSIQPLVVVGITAFDRVQEYGVAGYPGYQDKGASAEKYSNFIINELLPFVKKKSAVRKFNSVTIAGTSDGGLSAFDIAWDHADKIDKAGIFSGSFGFSNLDATDTSYSDDKNRIIINKIRSSRKRPHLKYWFYAGGSDETADRDNDVIGNTKDLIELIKKKKVCPPGDIVYIEEKDSKNDDASWGQIFPRFLVWAVGK